MSASLDIILVNRNSGGYLRACLSSMTRTNRKGIILNRVCVVDDDSSDDSLEGIGRFNLPLDIRRNRVHRGYGASCNLGAANSRSDYLLFLNTDTSLSAESLLAPLLYMERPEHYDVAITGIQLLDESGGVSRSCARFPTIGRFFASIFGLNRLFPTRFLSHQMKEWDHLRTQEVDQVIGAFLVIRRSVFDRLDGYDERFFVYMEDLDLSMRVRALGLKSVFLSTTYAYHTGGGTSRRVKAESTFFLLRSRIQYGFKHFGLPSALLLMCGTVLIEPVSRVLFGIVQGAPIEIWNTIRAYGRLWQWLLSSRALRGLGRSARHLEEVEWRG